MSVLKKALSKWESRKMQLWLILFITSTVMYVVIKNVTFSEWSDFQIWSVGIFVVGNGTEYVSDAMKGGKKTETKSADATPPEV